MSSPVWTLIQARLGSTRLPRKVLADLGGSPLIDWVVERAAKIGYPVCLCIPRDDMELVWHSTHRGWMYFGGDEEDVLGRFAVAASALGADHVIRVTADCPFLDVEAAKWTVDAHLERDVDFTHYKAEGRAIEVFKTAALLRADKAAPRNVRFLREHPDEWILHNPRRFSIHELKFSVDTESDLEIARRRIESYNLEPGNRGASSE